MDYSPVQYLVTGIDKNGKRFHQSWDKLDIADTTHAYMHAIGAYTQLAVGTLWIVSTDYGVKSKSMMKYKSADGRSR
jgi:hypothetical protein